MRKIAILLCLMFVAIFPQRATAAIAQHPPTSFFCPKGAALPDGCGQAPAPLTAAFFQPNGFQPGGYINQTAATVANYMNTNCGVSANLPCRPQWNVACFDYACGPYTPITPTCTKTVWDGTCLLDPAMVGSGITLAGAAYSSTLSGTGAGTLSIGNSGFLGTLAHYNFGPVNGHGCTALRILGAASPTDYFIDDIYYLNDSGLCSEAPLFNNAFTANPGFSKTLHLSNILMDGNARTWPDEQGGCATALCNPGSAWNLSVTGLIITNTAVVNFAGRTFSMPASGGGIVTMTNSYVEGWLTKALWGHGEFYLGGGAGGTMGSITLNYMTAVDRWDTQQGGEAPIFPATSYPYSFGSLDIDHFVNVNASVGKASHTGTYTVCIGATFSGVEPCSGGREHCVYNRHNG